MHCFQCSNIPSNPMYNVAANCDAMIIRFEFCGLSDENVQVVNGLLRMNFATLCDKNVNEVLIDVDRFDGCNPTCAVMESPPLPSRKHHHGSGHHHHHRNSEPSKRELRIAELMRRLGNDNNDMTVHTI